MPIVFTSRMSVASSTRCSVPLDLRLYDKNGDGTLDADAEIKDYPGIYVGLYRVRISKKANGKETITARCNPETELGREVATDIREGTKNVMFRLTSK
jgi:hypothetical protein